MIVLAAGAPRRLAQIGGEVDLKGLDEDLGRGVMFHQAHLDSTTTAIGTLRLRGSITGPEKAAPSGLFRPSAA